MKAEFRVDQDRAWVSLDYHRFVLLYLVEGKTEAQSVWKPPEEVIWQNSWPDGKKVYHGSGERRSL